MSGPGVGDGEDVRGQEPPHTDDPESLTAEDLPSRFGRFVFLELLGEGGMARVFKARLEGPGGFRKYAAVKVVRSELIHEDPDLRRSLRNEARLGGLLKHPNIVETYDYGEQGDTPYLVLEYVRGVGLDQALARGPLSPAIAVDVARQICAGLEHAHDLADAEVDAELVHRDLKPSNVLLTRDGLAKVMDFGIAKAAAVASQHTETGIAKGTPTYMSPEQAQAFQVDRRSDLFSLGALIYELVTGRRLFARATLTAVLLAIVQAEKTVDEARLVAELDAAVPGLGPIVARCLRTDPELRWSTALELDEALGAVAPPVARSSLATLVRRWQSEGRGPRGPVGTESLAVGTSSRPADPPPTPVPPTRLEAAWSAPSAEGTTPSAAAPSAPLSGSGVGSPHPVRSPLPVPSAPAPPPTVGADPEAELDELDFGYRRSRTPVMVGLGGLLLLAVGLWFTVGGGHREAASSDAPEVVELPDFSFEPSEPATPSPASRRPASPARRATPAPARSSTPRRGPSVARGASAAVAPDSRPAPPPDSRPAPPPDSRPASPPDARPSVPSDATPSVDPDLRPSEAAASPTPRPTPLPRSRATPAPSPPRQVERPPRREATTAPAPPFRAGEKPPTPATRLVAVSVTAAGNGEQGFLTVVVQVDGPAPESLRLHFRSPGDAWASRALSAGGGGSWGARADVPSGPVDWYLEGRGAGGGTLLEGSRSAPRRDVVP